jgi:hypothetical protein
MRRPTRWLFAVVGALFLWRAGISIVGTPRHEVLYNLSRPMRICVPSICTTVLRLEVGNTGTAAQDGVRVRLRAAPLRSLPLPVTVRNFGKVDRRVQMSEDEGLRVYELGRLEPQVRVEIEIVFLGQADDVAPDWPDVFVGVEPHQGEAKVGDPALVLFARWMHAFFGWL